MPTQLVSLWYTICYVWEQGESGMQDMYRRDDSRGVELQEIVFDDQYIVQQRSVIQTTKTSQSKAGT